MDKHKICRLKMCKMNLDAKDKKVGCVWGMGKMNVWGLMQRGTLTPALFIKSKDFSENKT